MFVPAVFLCAAVIGVLLDRLWQVGVCFGGLPFAKGSPAWAGTPTPRRLSSHRHGNGVAVVAHNPRLPFDASIWAAASASDSLYLFVAPSLALTHHLAVDPAAIVARPRVSATMGSEGGHRPGLGGRVPPTPHQGPLSLGRSPGQADETTEGLWSNAVIG